MTRKQLPFFLAFLVLMFGAMACACLGSGAGISGITATANAAYTQAVGAATAGAQGNTLAATASAAETQALATANAAGGGSTSGGATNTPAAGQPTSASSGGNGSAIDGGPTDIPAISGDKTNVVATAQLVSYQTKTDSAAVITFYKDAMPKNGWTADPTTSVETSVVTTLGFKKDTRTAIVTVTKDASSGGTLVAIAIQ